VHLSLPDFVSALRISYLAAWVMLALMVELYLNRLAALAGEGGQDAVPAHGQSLLSGIAMAGVSVAGLGVSWPCVGDAIDNASTMEIFFIK
jgi:hypothetical protein